MEIALANFETMLEDRGYVPIYYSEKSVSPDLATRIHERTYVTDSGKLAFSAIVDSTANLKTYGNYIEDDEYSVVLIIYVNSVTVAHRAIESLMPKVEIWSITNLMINPTRHFLCPKIEKIKKKIDIPYKIPKISFYDPLCRYFEFKNKDILKITDADGYISYRKVS